MTGGRAVPNAMSKVALDVTWVFLTIELVREDMHE